MLGTFYADEKFLSTPSARRATAGTSARRPSAPISIHALREEGDWTFQQTVSASRDFYPRPPRGGRPRPRWISACGPSRFLSTPSARRATDDNRPQTFVAEISIHALREEGDDSDFPAGIIVWSFLSTPSARRATARDRAAPGQADNFYPRPPRGGRQLKIGRASVSKTISIHALREEGDAVLCGRLRRMRISIHALREEGDLHPVFTLQPHSYFYPRPPRGGRRQPHL